MKGGTEKRVEKGNFEREVGMGFELGLR